MPNGASSGTASTPAGNAGSNFLPNNGRVIQNGGVRILCVADVRGTISNVLSIAADR